MTARTVTLDLPEPVYQQLIKTANASQQTLDTVVLQSIRVGLPPNLDHFPESLRGDLRILDSLSDNDLWQIAHSEIEDERAALYEDLLARNQNDEITEAESTQLALLRQEADILMFRRAYAYALLKWRGHRIPTLADFHSR